VKIHVSENGWVSFYCPACKMRHSVSTDPRHSRIGTDGKPVVWTFNGNLQEPTITPSLNTWSEADGKIVWRCHSNVTKGEITFHGDCTHALRGRHPMVDFPADYGFAGG
jgi:hypothetical protein